MDAKGFSSSAARVSDRGAMKRSESELALEEYLKMEMILPLDPSFDGHFKTDFDDSCFLISPTSAAAETWEMARGNLTSSREIEEPLWCQNLMTTHSTALAPASTLTDSQSSVLVGSPMSVSKPRVGSRLGGEVDNFTFLEESDDDYDGEIELGACEQSANPNDKHSRRKISNRDSARRSRKRKQEFLVGLEVQVKHLSGENETLLKQLAGASQQFRDANTNNRVLKSDVEALRAKVKLAEDMVARGSVNCNFSHLLQGLNLQPSLNFRGSINRMTSVSPSVNIHGDNNSSFSTGSTITRQSSCTGFGNGDSGNSNRPNGMMGQGQGLSCVSEIWR
ncbi:hypothetical protein SAY87_009730 [Trapa incisa]|uniref:BZIP domain-containing protein n=1 Tax=Trapa incisa TaxID=236973 RepID=A0AAN7PYG5_9MYRT|nr:hypothetical protein SAY87_009730 [Trapa incisa]